MSNQSEEFFETSVIKLSVTETDSLESFRDRIGIVPNEWPNTDKTVYPSSVTSVTKLFSQNSVPYSTLTDITSKTELLETRGVDWVAPALVVSGLLLTNNASAISLALGIIANYVSSLFTGRKKDPFVRMVVFLKTTKRKSVRKIQYKGPASSLPDLQSVLERIVEDERPET